MRRKGIEIRGIGLASLVLALLLPGCGPVSLADAEQQCIEQAQYAQRPRGSISVGGNNRGEIGTRVTIGISSDFVQGRDPDQVYASCVLGKAGTTPSRPFSSLPESHL
jgi:hypothetical protein